MEDNTKEQVLKKKPSKKMIAIIAAAVALCVLVGVGVIIAVQNYLPEQSAQPYQIQFYADGQLVDTVSLSGTGSITLPKDPNKPGTTFEGWFLDDGTWQQPFSKDYFAQNAITKNTSVYAKLVSNQYKVSFMVKGETLGMTEVIFGEKIGNIPAVPEKENYIPVGWTIEGVLVDENTVWTYSADKVAEPQYKGENFTLTLTDENGTQQQIAVQYGEKMTKLPQPAVKEGYLGYWSIDGTILLENSRWWYAENKTAQAVYTVVPVYYNVKIYLKETADGEYIDSTADFLDYVAELSGEDGKWVNITELVNALWPDGYQLNLRASQLAGMVSQATPLTLNVYFDKSNREDIGNQLPGDGFDFGVIGETYVLTFEGENGAITSMKVVCGSPIGKLPQVPHKPGYTGVWCIGNKVITESTVWSSGSDKVAKVVYTPNNNNELPGDPLNP